MTRSGILVVTLLLLGLFPLSCATREPIRGQEVTGLDKKLSKFAFIEEGKIITLIVDMWPARDRDGQAYMPLEIAVANTGVRSLALSRESFTLIDEEGNRYPMASPTELIEHYPMLDFDRNLAELEGIIFAKFGAFTRYDSNFSPLNEPGRVIIDKTNVPRFGYVIDFIYFPKPVTGIMGKKFELFLDSPQLEEPVFVKFEVR
jgi:hypothetical protein